MDGFVEASVQAARSFEKSLDNYGLYPGCGCNMEDAIDAANAIASEHLEIVTKESF